MAAKQADPVVPLADAAKFLSLTPAALQALRIALDPQQTNFKVSALIDVLKARTVAQQQAARQRAAKRNRKWFS
jgi:hypothetical protein